jgi:hypothetical protein
VQHNISIFQGVAGFYRDHVIHDIVHNRTANVTGGEGKNLELDLVNEERNNDYKSKKYQQYFLSNINDYVF